MSEPLTDERLEEIRTQRFGNYGDELLDEIDRLRKDNGRQRETICILATEIVELRADKSSLRRRLNDACYKSANYNCENGKLHKVVEAAEVLLYQGKREELRKALRELGEEKPHDQ